MKGEREGRQVRRQQSCFERIWLRMHAIRVGRISDGIYVHAVALPRAGSHPEQLG